MDNISVQIYILLGTVIKIKSCGETRSKKEFKQQEVSRFKMASYRNHVWSVKKEIKEKKYPNGKLYLKIIQWLCVYSRFQHLLLYMSSRR